MDTSTYRAMLKKEAEELKTALGHTGALDHTVVGDWVSTPEEPIATEADEDLVADRAEAALTRDAELAALESRYNNVQRALQKLTTETFGTCELCGNAIETARLDANPAARTCITDRDREVELSY